MLRILFLLPCLFGARSAEGADLLTLNGANFDEVTTKNDITLVIFALSSCELCAELETKLKAAWDHLEPAHRASVALAKVDAVAEAALATRLGVGAPPDGGGYPALRLFTRQRPGQPKEFAGPLNTTEGIAAWLVEELAAARRPALSGGLHRLTEANLTEALAQQPGWLVAFVDLTSDDGRSADALEGLRAAAAELRGRGESGDPAVGYADARGAESAMAQRLGVRTYELPAFVVLRMGQDWAVPFTHPLSGPNLAKFYRAHGTEAAAGVRMEAARVFATADELDAMNGGLDALLVASSSALPAVRRFFDSFLVESGFFYERRIEGALLSAKSGLAARLGVDSPDALYVRRAPRLVTEREPTVLRYNGPLVSVPALKEFFDHNSLPRLGLFAWNTRWLYLRLGRPLCIFYTELSGGWSGDAGQVARDRHARLARLLADRGGTGPGTLLAMADETQEAEEAATFGFDESSAEVNLGCYDAARRRFAMPESDGPDPGDVRRFLDAFESGAAAQRLRSVTVPVATDGRKVTDVNAKRLEQLAADGDPVLLIQCDFAKQPCAHSLGEFAAAADAAAAANADAADADAVPLRGVRFARLNTRLNDAPGELYYRFQGDSAADLTSAEPQVVLLRSGPGRGLQNARATWYQHDAVAKAYLLRFLAENLQAPSRAARQEL